MRVAPPPPIVAGLPFGRASGAVAAVPMGVRPTPAGDIVFRGRHPHRDGMSPTGVRGREAGFVHPWGRFPAIFAALIPKGVGVTGVFTPMAAGTAVVAPVSGPMGPRTRTIAPEGVSHRRPPWPA